MAIDYPLQFIDRNSISYPILLYKRLVKMLLLDFGQSAV